jgi:DNA-binding winged helix-turn-helix (wHTH) protein/Flp pilus assembly protein TadD
MAKCFRFGEYTLYPESGELYKKTRKVRVGPHAMQFLASLLEAAGRTVSREDLESRLWPKYSVGTNSLNVVASTARKLLGEVSEKPKFIKTVGRQGYCFIGPVLSSDADQYSEINRAETNYRKGMLLWEARTEKSLKKSIQAFRQAITDNPSFALAYAGLADAFTMSGLHGMAPPEEAFLRARAAAARALQIDPRLTEAKCSEAWVKLCFDWDWVGAEAGFSEVLREKPKYPFAWNGLSLLRIALGRADEALAAMRTAWTQDAVSPPLSALLAHASYFARRFSEAVEQAQRALAFNEDFPIGHAALGMAYLQLSNYAGAIQHLESAYELSGRSPVMLGHLGYGYGVSGARDKAQQALEQLFRARSRRCVLSYSIALTCLGVGDFEQALAWLERACEEHSHWVLFLRVDPVFDAIRADSRFAALLRHVNFPEAETMSIGTTGR